MTKPKHISEFMGDAMAESINAALKQAMERDSDTILLGEDVGLSGGVFRITEGLQSQFGEGRVIDTPLNESGIIGSAIVITEPRFKYFF